MSQAASGSVLTGQVIDTLSTEEFIAQVHVHASAPELLAISEALVAKSVGFKRIFGDESHLPDAAQLRAVLRSIFATRRRADQIISSVGSQRLGEACVELLNVKKLDQESLSRFDDVLRPAGEVPFELAFELLHFARPDSFWLWTRWIFDPRTETGALPLLVADEVDLFGRTPAETYLKLGAALAFLHEHAQAAGTAAMGEGPFAVDVLLACVYAVYMYTVLRLRMTQEFNRIVPVLPELVRRLLGVQQMEV